MYNSGSDSIFAHIVNTEINLALLSGSGVVAGGGGAVAPNDNLSGAL